MEQLQYKKEFEKSFLILSLNEENYKKYEIKMITQNKIFGFLPCKIRHDAEGEKLFYDVTSKKSLEAEYRDRQMSFEEMKGLFFQLGKIIKGAGEHLLNTSNIWFYPEYIFLDLETEEVYGIYCPVQTVEMEAESAIPRLGKYHALADFLLEKINHKEDRAVNAAYKFYKMSKEAYFSFEDFLSVMEKESLINEATYVKEETNVYQKSITDGEGLYEYMTPKQEALYEEKPDTMLSVKWPAIFLCAGVVLEVIYMIIPQVGKLWWWFLVGGLSCIVMAIILFIKEICRLVKKRKEELYKEPDDVMSIDDFFGEEDSQTVFFNTGMEDTPAPTLRWFENGEEKSFCVKEFPLIIGKQKSKANMIIDDASVSRSHARIDRKRGILSIEDLDSTNGTFVNKKRVYPGEDVSFQIKDEIQIGKIIIDVV